MALLFMQRGIPKLSETTMAKILFEKDWDKYPNAIADWETPNRTFVRYCVLLKKKGISNCAFPLALMQPHLQGVDPFDPALTQIQKASIAFECKHNYWYYVREISRIPVDGQEVGIPYIANRANISLAWSFHNHIDYASILPRQNGKSVSVDLINTWLMQLSGYRLQIQLFTKDAALRKANIERLKGFRDQLPAYINYTDDTDLDNTEEMSCNRWKNRYKTAVAQKDKARAENVGRGFTAAVIQNDEGPYCPNVHISLPVIFSSADKARENAAANGAPYGNLITTTAGKRDTAEGAYMYNLIHRGAYWTERFLDAIDEKDLHDIVSKKCRPDENGLVRTLINGTMSHLMIGRTNEWLRAAIANSGGNRDMTIRDYLNGWTSGSASSPLSNQLNDTVRSAAREPNYEQLVGDNYILRWFIPRDQIERRMKEGHFIMSLDSSNAVGKDGNGLLICDLASMELIAAADITEANLLKFGNWMASMLIQYPNITSIIENKSSGQALLDIIATRLVSVGIDPHTRMFNRVINEKERYRNLYVVVNDNRGKANGDTYITTKGKFGLMQTGHTRAFLYDTVLQRAAKSTGHLVVDQTLSDQVRGLVERNGRVDHNSGSNDDLVIAWLMAFWFAGYAINLPFYGIPRGYSLSRVHDSGAIMSVEQQQERAAVSMIKVRIEQLKMDLDNSTTAFEISIVKLELQRSFKQLDKHGIVMDDMTYDGIINAHADNKPTLGRQLRKQKRNTSAPRRSVML